MEKELINPKSEQQIVNIIKQIEKIAGNVSGSRQFNEQGKQSKNLKLAEINAKIIETIGLLEKSSNNENDYIRLWGKIKNIYKKTGEYKTETELNNIQFGLMAEKAVQEVLVGIFKGTCHAEPQEDIKDIDYIVPVKLDNQKKKFIIQLKSQSFDRNYIDLKIGPSRGNAYLYLYYNNDQTQNAFFNPLTGKPTADLTRLIIQEFKSNGFSKSET